MVSVCHAVPTWFSVHFQRPIEHDFGDRASHVGKQVFSDTFTTPLIDTVLNGKIRSHPRFHAQQVRWHYLKNGCLLPTIFERRVPTTCSDGGCSTVQKKTIPIATRKRRFLGSGIYSCYRHGKFCFDKSQTPHCTAPDIYSFFGVASSTGQGKSKQIRQWLKIHPFSFQWGLPSKFDSNPLIWMLTVNGMMVDVRHLPIEVQEEAYQKGLIPYVPGAKHS